VSVVDTHYLRRPNERRDRAVRRAAIARKAMAIAALKAAVLPPRQPVTAPAIRRKSSKR
jgi:hypothetical protein